MATKMLAYDKLVAHVIRLKLTYDVGTHHLIKCPFCGAYMEVLIGEDSAACVCEQCIKTQIYYGNKKTSQMDKHHGKCKG